MSAIESTAKSSTNPKTLIRMIWGALLGAVVCLAFIRLGASLHISAREFRWSDVLALWMGVVFIVCSIVTGLISTNRKVLAERLEGDEAKLPATNDEVRTLRMQTLTIALAGVMLLLPLLSLAHLGADGSAYRDVAVYAAIVVLFVLQAAANTYLWRNSDEFARQTMLKASAITFGIGQGLLFLYAAAERLHLVRAISSWDVITVALTLYLGVSIYMSIRQYARK